MLITGVLFVTVFSLHIYAKSSAHEGHSDHNNHDADNTKTMHKGHEETNAQEVTLKGKLIGLTCFIKHGSKGKNHKNCAIDCAKKGLPIGLLSEGKIYQISGSGHDSLVEAYKPLLKYMEGTAHIKGKVFKKNGIYLLVVNKIKK